MSRQHLIMSRQHLKLGFLHCVLHLLVSGNDAFRNEIHLDEVVITFGGGDNCELIYSLMDGVVDLKWGLLVEGFDVVQVMGFVEI